MKIYYIIPFFPLALPFESVNHFETLVHGVRKWSKFTVLHVDLQLSRITVEHNVTSPIEVSCNPLTRQVGAELWALLVFHGSTLLVTVLSQ